MMAIREKDLPNTAPVYQVNLYRKRIDYEFSDCEFGDVSFSLVEREGKLRALHFQSARSFNDFREGNIKQPEQIRNFTNWIADCIESTIKEYESTEDTTSSTNKR